MPIEIERKFLLANDGWRAVAHASVVMAQGYLNAVGAVAGGDTLASVRVRIAGAEAFLNIKSRESGVRRQEFEYAIPVGEARALLALCVGGRVEKTRHYVNHQGHLWEVDEFSGANAGLMVAEIELQREDEPFDRPDWLGAEVTMLPRYYNVALASHPYAQWCAEERNAVDSTQGS